MEMAKKAQRSAIRYVIAGATGFFTKSICSIGRGQRDRRLMAGASLDVRDNSVFTPCFPIIVRNDSPWPSTESCATVVCRIVS